MEENTGRWGITTAVWAIFAIIIVFGLFAWCHQQGKDKADLAASIQNLYGGFNCLKPQVDKYMDRTDAIGNGLSKVSQAQADFQKTAYLQLADLDDAVFVARCGCNHGCSRDGGNPRFVAKTNYNVASQTLEQIETCGGCCNG